MSEPNVGEIRRRRALMDDLVAGTDNTSAYARARDLGFDLHAPHWMVVTTYRAPAWDTTLARSVERAARVLHMSPLLGKRAELVLLLAQSPVPLGESGRWTRLHEEVVKLLPGPFVDMGVGGSCALPSDVPRSLHEAVRALSVRRATPRDTGGVTVYQDLRIDAALPPRADRAAAEEFVRQWLGPVREHDAREGSNLVETLATYIQHDGDIDAATLDTRVHRSTLRYRLHLAASLLLRRADGVEGSGPDIHERRNWPSLQTAVWVGRILDAETWQAP